MTTFVHDDGGRRAAGYNGHAGDCVVRAVAIATQRPYREVYDELSEACRRSRIKRAGRSARDGVPMPILKRYMDERGWKWTPTMSIGSGTTVHLKADELPSGRIIARLSRHVVAVVDGVVHDVYDPARDGTRAVYGYFNQGEQRG